MSLIPSPALRRLMAAGGGPAQTDRRLAAATAPLAVLLRPLDDTPLLRGTNLDVLLGDPDIGRMLGAALEAPAHAVEPVLPARPTSTKSSSPGAAAVSRRSVPVHAAPAAGPAAPSPKRNVTAAALLAQYEPARQAGRSARRDSSPGHAGDSARPAGDAVAVRSAGHAPAAAGETVRVRRRIAAPPGAAAGPNAASWAELPAARHIVSVRGAVTPPLAAVLTAASQAPPARRAAGARAGLTESRQAVNIGLEQALERVQLRVPTMPAASNMAPVASSMPAPASPLSPVALSAGRDDSASPGVTRGGFRGLAQRALKGERGPAPVPLAEENVVPRDVALDRLDTAVADSLARILVREAKRHGIDLAESVQ